MTHSGFLKEWAKVRQRNENRGLKQKKFCLFSGLEKDYLTGWGAGMGR
jgi:hypothetical protein